MTDQATIEQQRRARAMFMVRCGQIKRTRRRREYTAPLFPLVLILAADGTLAPDAKPLVELVRP